MIPAERVKNGVEFTGMPRSNTLKVLGIDLFSIGHIAPQDASDWAIDAHLDGQYYDFVFRRQVMAGAILLGDASLSARVKTAIESRQDFSQALAKTPGVKDILEFLGENG